jgi:hypothetical protein
VPFTQLVLEGGGYGSVTGRQLAPGGHRSVRRGAGRCGCYGIRCHAHGRSIAYPDTSCKRNNCICN